MTKKFLIEVETRLPPTEFVAWMNSSLMGDANARWVIADRVCPVNTEGPELQPYQQAWVDDPTQFRVWDCDRRIGSTTAVIEDALAVASNGLGGPVVVVVSCREREAMEMRDEIRARGHVTADVDGEYDHILVTSTRWPIRIFWHLKSSYLAHRGGALGQPALVVLDNAGVTPSEPPAAGLQDAMEHLTELFGARRLAVVGAEVRGLPEAQQVSRHVTTIRTAFEQGMGRRICAVRGDEWSPEWESEHLAKLRERYSNTNEFRF